MWYCRVYNQIASDVWRYNNTVYKLITITNKLQLVLSLKKLITLNNKLLRILQNKTNKFTVKDLYLNFDTLAIPELHTRQLLILVHKFLHHPHLLPTAFANYFTSNSTIHQHNTREKENLILASVSKDFGKRRVKIKASKLWNQLPLSLKDSCSVKQFGSKLKKYTCS